MKKREIVDQVVVITGASSGIGKATALHLAAAGASLILAARGKDELDEVAQECRNIGSRAVVVPTDVSVEEEVARLFDAALQHFGRIDVWINDAGVGAIGEFDKVPLEDHLKIIRTDLLGTISGSYHAFRYFREKRAGVLINVASVIGKIPAPYYASYTAAKYGVVGFDASLRQEIDLAGLDDVHVCTVLPMAMDTPFFDSAANYTGKEGAPIPPLYDAELVADEIRNLILHPKKETIVGGVGKVMSALHQLFPSAIEKAMGRQTEIAQMKKSDPAPVTDGALDHPVGGGDVHASRLRQ